MGGPVGTHIGLHQTYISYLIGIPYRLVPRPETLLVLQSLLIGAAALPLYAYARRHLGAWTACLVACSSSSTRRCTGRTCTTSTTCRSRRSSCGRRWRCWTARRDRWAAVAIVLTLANREDMSALLIVVGLYLLLTGERPRAGLIVAAIGAAYFVVVKFIVMPHFLGGATAYVHQYKDLVPAGRARLRRRPQDRARQPRLHGHDDARRRTRSSTCCRSWRRSRSSRGGGRSASCARCPASSSRCWRRSTRG